MDSYTLVTENTIELSFEYSHLTLKVISNLFPEELTTAHLVTTTHKPDLDSGQCDTLVSIGGCGDPVIAANCPVHCSTTGLFYDNFLQISTFIIGPIIISYNGHCIVHLAV